MLLWERLPGEGTGTETRWMTGATGEEGRYCVRGSEQEVQSKGLQVGKTLMCFRQMCSS